MGLRQILRPLIRDAIRAYDAVGNVIAVIMACVLQSASKQ
jgi:multisubunit Na+/H+ antiporter MnhF subunit